LIVVGSHGRKGLDRFFMGSVSEAVARHAHCSVQIVRVQSH
jgi:nucleotide-binding universal stress UspA family protein